MESGRQGLGQVVIQASFESGAARQPEAAPICSALGLNTGKPIGVAAALLQGRGKASSSPQ